MAPNPREDSAGPHARVRNPVRAGGERGTGEQHPRAEIRVRAGVPVDLDHLGDQVPVLRRPGAIPHHERVPLGARDHGLLAAPDHPDRPAGVPGEQRQVRLDGHVLLAAEPAAHVGRDDPHLVPGQLKDVRDRARVLDDLGGHAQRQHAVLDPPDPGLRLQVGVLDVLGVVGLLDHHVAALHRRTRVAVGDMPVDQHVPGLVDTRGVRRQRLRHRVDAGQLLVSDVHELGRGVGDLRRGGGDQRHGLPREAHPVRRQHRLGHDELAEPTARPLDDAVVGHVRRGEHGRDATERGGLRGVDRDDAGAGHRRADDLAVEHARQPPVGGVEQAALGLVPEVLLHRRRADDADGALLDWQ
jgi:hypothetical protein